MNHTSGRGVLLLVIVGVLLAALTIDTSDTQAQGEMPFYQYLKKINDSTYYLPHGASDTTLKILKIGNQVYVKAADGDTLNLGDTSTVLIDSLNILQWICLNDDTITAWPAAGGMDSGEVMIVIRDTGYIDTALTATVIRDTGAVVFQPLEATLTDIADGTIAENLVNTAYPWADDEVADNITITNNVLVTNLNDSIAAARADIRDTIGVITDLDSANVSANGLSLSDMDWDYERVYLTNVHSFANALEDSIFLYDHVHLANGDTLLLVIDSAGNITADDRDTVSISGYVPYACTIDSVLIRYMTGAEIIDGYLKGPDVSAGDNMVDSTYVSWATDLTSATWATAAYDITDIAASAGDRFAYKYVVNFGADNERLRIGWIALVVKR